MNEGEEKYRSIFEHSAVSLWEEDISRLRSRLAELKTRSGFSLRAHLAAHPDFVQEAVGLIDVTDVNRASLHLFEADRREQLLGPLDIVLDAVSRAAIAETILAIDEGTSDLERESTALTLKGSRLSLIVKTHIPPADAAYPSMLVSFIDITARKQAEERERLSTNILQSVMESSPNAMFVKDRALRMLLCNPAHSMSIGKSPAETYGKTDIENGWSAELVSGDPGKGIQGWEKDDRAALSGRTVVASAVPSDVGGEIRYFDTVKLPLRNDRDEIIGIFGVGRDVTERITAEEELRKAKEFAENLVDTAKAIILGLDCEGRVTVFNKTAEEVTGYTRSEMIGRSWFETVVPRAQYPQVWEKFEKLTGQAEVGNFENPIITKSGEERYISWNNSQIREQGRVTGTLSYGLDITDRRRMEQELTWERSLFNVLMENVPDRIYYKDTASRFIRTSWSQARAVGLENPSGAVGKTDADFYGADHALKALGDERQISRPASPS